MTTATRLPAVAGRFYPERPNQLLSAIHEYTSPPQTRVSAIGCVAPHAGYVYSGHVAGAVYARL
jgi:AmmeMemoRadiSam system protein B